MNELIICTFINIVFTTLLCVVYWKKGYDEGWKTRIKYEEEKYDPLHLGDEE